MAEEFGLRNCKKRQASFEIRKIRGKNAVLPLAAPLQTMANPFPGILLLLPLASFSIAAEVDFARQLEPVFAENCVRCHGENGKVKGKVDLLSLESAASLTADAERLQKLVEAIEYEEMPPEDEPQLEPKARAELLANLETLLEEALAGKGSFAHTPIRRMTRFQYNNAVIDLFQLNRVVFALPERFIREHKPYFDPASGKLPDRVQIGNRALGKSQLMEPRLAGVAPFPQDLRAEHGFDNRGDHLSLSPLLMEQFLRLSQSITRSRDFNAKTIGVWNEIFAAPSPNQPDAIRQRLTTLLSRAFREPVEDEVVERYAEFVEAKLAAGAEFPDAMKEVAAAVIASPRFLYLFDEGDEAAPADESGQVSGLELASRLSFFLWGSLPNDELRALGESGQLLQPDVLAQQTERLLRDRKLKRFCDSFPAQWLQLERILSSTPERPKFEKFYFGNAYRRSMHTAMEPLLLFEAVLVENRPITDLIDPDFTYRKSKDSVTSVPFERVAITDRREGGVITNPAVMTMTSGPDRTHPITRGAWLLTAVFNDPPAPPPADVPPLADKPAEGEEHLTLRERLTIHRERADCAGCHEKIDPLGFALENFDPIGDWRDSYENGREIEVGGKLFRKHEFGKVTEFKDAILAEKDRFARGLAGHLLSFALARELTAADSPALDEITAKTAADGYRLQTMIREVILSEPFRTKSTARESKLTQTEP